MPTSPTRPIQAFLATLLAVLLLIQTTGCTSWPAVNQPWPTTVTTQANRRVQVTLRDGWIVKGDSAAVWDDMLLIHHGGRTDPLGLQDISKIQFREMSPYKTAGLVLGIGSVVLFVVGAAIALGSVDCIGCSVGIW